MADWARSVFEEASRLLREHEKPPTTAASSRGRPGRREAATPRPAPVAWSVARLAAACRRKGILYDESSTLTGLSGVAAASGGTVLIRVRADLDERERLATLAHELAHVYRAQQLRRGAAPELLHTGDQLQEQAADIWAAHCLVRPAVYDAARIAHPGDEDGAVAETAERLNIPPRLVRLWLEHRDMRFAEEPLAWLERP